MDDGREHFGMAHDNERDPEHKPRPNQHTREPLTGEERRHESRRWPVDNTRPQMRWRGDLLNEERHRHHPPPLVNGLTPRHAFT